jgi:hypothetical protein
MHPSPPREKKRLPVVAWLLLGVFGALLLTCGAGVAWLVSSEKGRKFLEAAQETAEVFDGAATAPGTVQLKALGCEEAAVLRGEELLAAFERFGVELPQPDPKHELPRDLLIVFCRNGMLGDAPPGCGEIARTYAAAVPAPPERFMVHAEKRGKREAGCRGVYSPTGELLHALPEQG